MFRNDYSEACAGEVLDALARLSKEQNIGYGEDVHSERAKGLIKDFFGLGESADVHFIAGGTQTNMTVISYFLRPYECVIACDTGHINVHETGAIEGSGHKVITCKGNDGKLDINEAEKLFNKHSDEHMVKPAMVYISDTTETGTVYSKSELEEIRAFCDRHGLILYLDGARLGVALTAKSDVTAKDIARLCDVFYVGGTKNGALFGEAVVIKNGCGAKDFRYHIKNRGAMLAKGFVVAAMFEALFEDGLYLRLAENSNRQAEKIKEALVERGVELYGQSPTNQIFVTLENAKAQALMDRFGCEKWLEAGEKTVVRIVTSFATKDEETEEIIKFFN